MPLRPKDVEGLNLSQLDELIAEGHTTYQDMRLIGREKAKAAMAAADQNDGGLNKNASDFYGSNAS